MPLRGHTSAFKIGVDIIRTSRITRIRERLPDGLRQKFLRKVFTEREVQALMKSGEAAAGWDESVDQLIAGRWAAKEAVIKAFAGRRLYMRDVEIYKRSTGSPFAVVLDPVARERGPASSSSATDRGERTAAAAAAADAAGSRCAFDDDGEEVAERHVVVGGGMRMSGSLEGMMERDGYGRCGGERRLRGLVAAPESLDMDGQYVDVSISTEEDYCVAVALVQAGG